MKFSEYRYERPDVKQLEQQFKAYLGSFQSAVSSEEQDRILADINKLRSELDTQMNLVSIRHSINTLDPFYKAEKEYMDEIEPVIQEYITDFYRALVHSKFREELERKWGSQLFRLADLSLKTFHPAIIEDLQRENKLSTEFGQLLASAKIPFKGEERTLPQLTPFEQSADRQIRRQAAEARYQFMAEQEEQLDRIFDYLVSIRTKIAKTLGFSSFTELGYARMNRIDYNAEMVARFRSQVRELIVPAATKLVERQRRRIGVERMTYYDEPFSFKTGNAVPKGDSDWIVANGAKMYAELSPETDEFFQFMLDNELMDLDSKKGKEGGGYCTFLRDYQAPFIFSNFNGTKGDIDVLTHEVGHAFQSYMSRHFEVPEYLFPTMEAAEIHSMSMEFFTSPWSELFFEEDADKFKFQQLASALLFIPYGVAVDEFQHFVYEHPEASPAERKSQWKRLEQTYLPHRNYDGMEYLERGGFWQKQLHIFQTPFYYIDYTLAQICALQFWMRMNKDWDSAWKDYLQLCRIGGSQSFTSLVQSAGLISPFEEGCVSSVIGDIENWLDQIDDSVL